MARIMRCRAAMSLKATEIIHLSICKLSDKEGKRARKTVRDGERQGKRKK